MTPDPNSDWGPASDSSRFKSFRAGWSTAGDARPEASDEPGVWKQRMCDERVDPKWDQFSWITVRALFESVNDVLAKLKPQFVHERRARWVSAQRDKGVVAGSSSRAAGDPGDLSFAQALSSSLSEALDHLPLDFDLAREWRQRLLGEAGSAARDPADFEFVVDQRSPAPTSFLLIGDTGEQDASQYAATPALISDQIARDPDGNEVDPQFMFILSDVIYPAGDINEYVNGSYIPYRKFEKPIYAVPGNHDWYDGLNGFMYHFCGAEPLPTEGFRYTAINLGTRFARLLWRGAEPPDRPLLARWRDSRPWGRDAAKAVQPAPYFAIDTGDLLLVGIDTGVSGEIDDEQGRWLLEVSKVEKQKILLTGKPIYVDGEYHPGPIIWTRGSREDRKEQLRFKTVDDIVRHQPFGYVAAIGGDVHNYQRYPVRLSDQDRTILYLVSGGGGAYLSPTDRIPPVGLRPRPGEHPWPRNLEMPADEGFAPAVPEREQAEALGTDPHTSSDERHRFHCYPMRGDSLAYNARTAAPRFFNAVVLAAAGFVSSAYLFLWGVPLDDEGRLAILTPYAIPALFGVLWLLFWHPLRSGVTQILRRSPPKLFADPPPAASAAEAEQDELIVGHRADRFFKPLAGIVGGVLAVGALAWGADAIAARLLSNGPSDLLGSGRYWAMVGVSVVVPLLVVAAILLTYDSRGSVPRVLRTLLVVVGLAGAGAIFFDIPGGLGAPAWFLTVLGLLAAVAAGLFALGHFRRRQVEQDEDGDGTWKPKDEEWPKVPFIFDRLLVALSPALLTCALAVELDARWIFEFVVAIAAAAAIPFVLAIALGSGGSKPLCSASAPWRARLSAVVAVASTSLWLAALLVLLDQIGDGWIARAGVGAFAFLIVGGVSALLAAVAAGTGRKRFWFALVLALALVGAGGISPVCFAVLSVLLFGQAVWSVRRFARGRLNADRAIVFIRNRLGLAPLPQERGSDPPHGAEEELADLLYPYGWEEDRKQGKPGRTGVPVMLAHLIAEMSDADQPPFFKHFLRFDIRKRDATQSDDTDREVVIRCFGVTGYATEEGRLPVEDKMSIGFYSPERYEPHRDPSQSL